MDKSGLHVIDARHRAGRVVEAARGLVSAILLGQEPVSQSEGETELTTS
jgi:hypothetical protein